MADEKLNASTYKAIKSLSENKSLFFEKGDINSRRLTSEQIRRIISHYSERGICIYFNGETDFGKTLIEQNKDLLIQDRTVLEIVSQMDSDIDQKLLEKNIKELNQKIEDVCLNREQALQEIYYIQK